MLESWSSTAFSTYGTDLGVKSTPLQSNKITDASRDANRDASRDASRNTGRDTGRGRKGNVKA